jgi:hypothetical protein
VFVAGETHSASAKNPSLGGLRGRLPSFRLKFFQTHRLKSGDHRQHRMPPSRDFHVRAKCFG